MLAFIMFVVACLPLAGAAVAENAGRIHPRYLRATGPTYIRILGKRFPVA